jgi:hypothetical protein
MIMNLIASRSKEWCTQGLGVFEMMPIGNERIALCIMCHSELMFMRQAERPQRILAHFQ